jgi:hypothetical protein
VTRRLAMVAVTVLAIIGFAASPASAAANAYNLGSNYLYGDNQADDTTYCVSRHIYLAAGSYDWGVYYVQPNGLSWTTTERTITLGAGYYQWINCMDPRGDSYYQNSSVLNPDNPNWATASMPSHDFMPGYDGLWTWGGVLDPRF